MLAISSSDVKISNSTFSDTYKHFSLGRSWKAGLYPSAVIVSSLLPIRSLEQKSFYSELSKGLERDVKSKLHVI